MHCLALLCLILQIESAATTEDLRQLLSEDDFHLDCGYTKPSVLVTLQDKEELIQIIALDYLVYRSQAEIDQLIEGLKTAGVLELLRNQPEQMSAVFCGGQKELTADRVAEMLDPFFSESGSNNRDIEESIMFNAEMMLQKVEGGGKPSSCCLSHFRKEQVVLCMLLVYTSSIQNWI